VVEERVGRRVMSNSFGNFMDDFTSWRNKPITYLLDVPKESEHDLVDQIVIVLGIKLNLRLDYIGRVYELPYYTRPQDEVILNEQFCGNFTHTVTLSDIGLGRFMHERKCNCNLVYLTFKFQAQFEQLDPMLLAKTSELGPAVLACLILTRQHFDKHGPNIKIIRILI
jgi:hypothetical protein